MLETAAVVAALALAVPAAAPAGPPAGTSGVDVGTATQVIVTLGPHPIDGWMGSAQIEAKPCPDDAPFLEPKPYHEGTGWIIPAESWSTLGVQSRW